MSKTVSKPAWQTQWPRNGDLKTWFRVMIKKCAAIPDPTKAATQAHLPIEQLAQIGAVPEALRAVNQCLRRLSKQQVLETVRMANLGARICLDHGDLLGMEKYLSRAAATEPYNTRKCDRGFSLTAVHKFRVENGVLDPASAKHDEEGDSARFERAVRQCRQALTKGDPAQARAAAAAMVQAAPFIKDEWSRRSALRRLVECLGKLNDPVALNDCLRGFTPQEQHVVLDAKTLANLGGKAEAIARAQQDIKEQLDLLAKSKDPNIHFPVMTVSWSLEFLVQQEAKDVAQHWLQRTLNEMPAWPVIEQGWTTSAVYSSLGKAVALIEGPAAARQLVQQAMADAQQEPRNDFRKGAVSAALKLKAGTGELDAAIADARKLRSPTGRRKELARLLARAQRWNELRSVLSEVASPEEAAEIAWWIKFELPGGAAR